MPTTSLVDSKYFTVTCVLILILGLFPGLPQFLLGLPLCALKLAFSTRQFSSPSNIVTCPTGCAPLDSVDMSSSWFQKTFTLPSKSRGSYLITDHVESSLPEIKDYKVGILNLFVQHTSCALSLNENWDSDVREDMSDALDRIAPEDRKGNLYRHSAEGLDDMPAHIKSALIGASVTIPITNGTLNIGTWQGIWYLEFRASKHTRKVVATIQGEKR
ncbi:secondary thiamine-phosphate synthase enzyme [Exophiala spinifera]|uniref:Secondary thiamine-phosphate synthase enzyme n=1 Tax=Exophiala spinifera TaxID=91928 RepID=A0A0D1ZGK6_9EURO|nr:secondary thiamine-phosphate synthase enzyme [Exophiala spinifera]KIW12102.1 secondary thiamine-phosphate synthase enzyme [Exophiala spinifera]